MENNANNITDSTDQNNNSDQSNGNDGNQKDNRQKKNNNRNDKKNFSHKDEKLIEEQEKKYTDGQELTFVRVRFPGNAKSFPFLLGKRLFTYGQKVIAMSDRGMALGYINSFPYKVNFDKSMLPIRTIAKLATDEDIEEQMSYERKVKEAEVLCLRLIDKHNLDMNLTHVEYIQFGKKAVFYFNAPERVDFRGLVKDLVADLKTRIELRQISVRDRAAALGAVGACGLQTCCSSFLTSYGNVSIKMAKNQNLALIPSKINGVCGQLKCCTKYEDDVYTEKRKLLPRREQYIRTANGDIGKILKLHIILEQFEMLTDKGYIRRYAKNQYDPKNCFPPKEWQFPTEFKSITKETSDVIGLSDVEEKMLDRYTFDIGREDIDTDGDEDNGTSSSKQDSSDSDDESSKDGQDNSKTNDKRRNNRGRNNRRPRSNNQKNNDQNDGDKSQKNPTNKRRNNNRRRNNKNRTNRDNKKESTQKKSDS